MLNTNALDIVFGFDDTMYHLSSKNYNLKAIKTSRICLVSKNELSKEYTLLSEYENAQNKSSIFKNLPGNPTVTVCTGKAENCNVTTLYFYEQKYDTIISDKKITLEFNQVDGTFDGQGISYMENTLSSLSRI